MNGGAWHGVRLTSATATSVTESLAFGAKYRYRVGATDRLGHVGSYAYGPTFVVKLVQQGTAAIKSIWHYTTVRASAASGGSLKYQPYSGADFTYTFTARGIAWISVKGPTRANVVDVFVDRALVRSRMSLASSSTHYRYMAFARNFPSLFGAELYVRNLGVPGHQRLDIDAFILLTYV